MLLHTFQQVVFLFSKDENQNQGYFDFKLVQKIFALDEFYYLAVVESLWYDNVFYLTLLKNIDVGFHDLGQVFGHGTRYCETR